MIYAFILGLRIKEENFILKQAKEQRRKSNTDIIAPPVTGPLGKKNCKEDESKNIDGASSDNLFNPQILSDEMSVFIENRNDNKYSTKSTIAESIPQLSDSEEDLRTKKSTRHTLIEMKSQDNSCGYFW